MRRITLFAIAGYLLLIAGAAEEALAAPFVDSVIVVSKTFPSGSQGVIEVKIHNDSAINSINLPLVIRSETGGAFGRVDSIQYTPAIFPLGMTPSLTRVNGASPDSMFVLSIDSGGGSAPPAPRRIAYKIFVTNNTNPGTYSLDSNRTSPNQFLKFTHPPTQANVPAFVRGVELIGSVPNAMTLVTTQVTLFKGKESCVTVGGTLCDTTSLRLTIDSVKVQHSGDPDLSCSTAVGATNLVGKTFEPFSCATDSGNGFLRVCQAPTASIGDTGTCRITFFGTLGVGAAARVVSLSAVVSMAAGSTGATVVPTLTQWGLALFGVLLAGMLGYVYYRRRKRSTSCPVT